MSASVATLNWQILNPTQREVEFSIQCIRTYFQAQLGKLPYSFVHDVVAALIVEALLYCRDMLSPEDTKAFFLQLLPGLLSNLQPLQEPAQQQLQLQLQDSPLRGPSTSLLAAICQLLGSQQYLQQVLHFAGHLANPAAPVNPKALEVLPNALSHNTCVSHAKCMWSSGLMVIRHTPIPCVTGSLD